MKDAIVKFFVSIKHVTIQLGWLLALIIPIFVFINGAIFTIVEAQENTIETRLYTSAEKELQNIDLFVKSKLNAVHSDIHIILDTDETVQYLADPTAFNIEEYQAMLYRIAVNRPTFTNMMMVDTNGDILYQISYQDETTITESYDAGTITTNFYYSVLQQMADESLFMSQLYIKNNKPTMTFVSQLLNDNDEVVSYLVVDYDANDLALILGLYTNEEDTYFNYGILNNGVVWQIDKEKYAFDINADLAYRNQLFEQMTTNDSISTLLLPLSEISDHTYIEDDNNFRFFITLDIDSAIQDSESVFLNNAQLIAVIANMIAGVMLSYIAYMVRVRKDDRLLINANMYLSVQNQDGISIVNNRLRIIYGNPAFEKMFGYTENEFYLKKVHKLLKIGFIPLKMDLKNLTDYAAHAWYKTKTGVYLMNYLQIKKETFFAGRDKHYISIYSDSKVAIDDYKTFLNDKEKTLNELLRFFNYHPVTINHTTLFLIRFEHANAYDFANYLKRLLNQKYVIAIVKTNIIIIYANIPNSEAQKETIRIDNYIETYKTKPETSHDFSHDFVITKATKSVHTMSLLLEAAFAGLSFAKEKKHLRYLVYHHHIKEHVEREKRIENELANGFKNQEFYLEYQMLKDLSTDQFVGAEALLRWKNPRLGQVSPGHFIPVIENSFYINQLTLMVLNIAIYDFEQMKDQLRDDFRISINLSQFDMSNDYIIDHIIYKIDQSQLSTSNFVFEITEKQYLYHLERTNQIIDKCHEHGILVAVDDFGTGYVSINLLRSIKADFIKIDRSYIKNYPAEDGGVMLDTLIDMIRRFDKPVIIEGVETAIQYQHCLDKQCRYAQGYYFAKPITVEAFKTKYIK